MSQQHVPHPDNDPRHIPHEIRERGREGSFWDRLWQSALETRGPATHAIYFAAPFTFGVSSFAIAVARELRRMDSALVNTAYGAGLVLFAASLGLVVMGLWNMNWVGRIATAYVAVKLLRTWIGHAQLSFDDVALPFMICLSSEIAGKILRDFRSSRRREEEGD